MKHYRLPAPDACGDIWERLVAERRPIVIYGMGNGADKLLRVLTARGIEAADFVASDGFVRGQTFHGHRVLSFTEVQERYEASSPILLMAFGSARPDVLAQVETLCKAYDLLIPDLPVAGETLFDAAYYKLAYPMLEETAAYFSDETSRDLLAALVQYKLTGDSTVLLDAWTEEGEAERLLGVDDIETYVDVGAYTGDTLRTLLAIGAPLRRAVCIEPDLKNFRRLAATAEGLTAVDVRCIRAAAWSEAGEATFYGSGNRNASLLGASYQHTPIPTPLISVDEAVGTLLPDYIKYDTEGAEEPSLLGSTSTIRAASPRLRVAAYHRTEDLVALPRLLRTLCPRYALYLRRRRCIPAWETDLIAIPKGRSSIEKT